MRRLGAAGGRFDDLCDRLEAALGREPDLSSAALWLRTDPEGRALADLIDAIAARAASDAFQKPQDVVVSDGISPKRGKRAEKRATIKGRRAEAASGMITTDRVEADARKLNDPTTATAELSDILKALTADPRDGGYSAADAKALVKDVLKRSTRTKKDAVQAIERWLRSREEGRRQGARILKSAGS